MQSIHKTSVVIFTVLSVLILALAVFAQEAPPPAGKMPAPLPEQTAEVVIYRPKRFAGSALKPSVYVDARQVARLGNGRFFSIQLPAGQHVFTSTTTNAPRAHVDMKAGSKSYLEMVLLPSMGGVWGKAAWRLIPVAEVDAQDVLRKLKPLDAKWIVEQPKNDAK